MVVRSVPCSIRMALLALCFALPEHVIYTARMGYSCIQTVAERSQFATLSSVHSESTARAPRGRPPPRGRIPRRRETQRALSSRGICPHLEAPNAAGRRGAAQLHGTIEARAGALTRHQPVERSGVSGERVWARGCWGGGERRVQRGETPQRGEEPPPPSCRPNEGQMRGGRGTTGVRQCDEGALGALHWGLQACVLRQ